MLESAVSEGVRGVRGQESEVRGKHDARAMLKSTVPDAFFVLLENACPTVFFRTNRPSCPPLTPDPVISSQTVFPWGRATPHLAR